MESAAVNVNWRHNRLSSLANQRASRPCLHVPTANRINTLNKSQNYFCRIANKFSLEGLVNIGKWRRGFIPEVPAGRTDVRSGGIETPRRLVTSEDRSRARVAAQRSNNFRTSNSSFFEFSDVVCWLIDTVRFLIFTPIAFCLFSNSQLKHCFLRFDWMDFSKCSDW